MKSLSLSCLPLLFADAKRADWTKLGKSPPETVIEFTIGLKSQQRGLDVLEKAFWEISDPKSPSFGKHLTFEEVNELVAPTAESIDAVKKWLSTVSPLIPLRWTPARDFVTAHITVDQAELLLPGLRYHAFQSRNTTIHRHESEDFLDYPASVKPFISLVAPVKHFPPARYMEAKRLAAPTASELTERGSKKLYPNDIRTLYKIGNVEAKPAANNTQHVAGFLNNYINPNDLEIFFNDYYPKGKGRKITIVGPNDKANPSIEGSLDIEYLMSIGANIPTTYWYTAGQRPYPGGENEPFLTWLNALTSSAPTPGNPLPHVISASYADEEYVIDLDFLRSCDIQFQKLAVRGTSLFFGSGDDGVTGDKGNCPGGKFVPWWPATSLYVTGVGATYSMTPPFAAASFSGGGFSNVYPAPSYQADAIAAFKKGSQVPLHYYNQTGRGFPDVSAVGVDFWIIYGGIPDEVGGTSASTPTFAGVVSLLNDARMAAGKTPLGFLNQLFYAHPEVFTDAVSGTNTGGGGCGYGGFTACKGWDPLSGWGSPLYDKMLALVMSLP